MLLLNKLCLEGTEFSYFFYTGLMNFLSTWTDKIVWFCVLLRVLVPLKEDHQHGRTGQNNARNKSGPTLKGLSGY